MPSTSRERVSCLRLMRAQDTKRNHPRTRDALASRRADQTPRLSLLALVRRRPLVPLRRRRERREKRELRGLVRRRCGGRRTDRRGGRPHRVIEAGGGTKSATRIGTMVNVRGETDDGNLGVFQQSQMQNEASTTQRTYMTKSSLVGDATKVSTPGVNANNTGHHQPSYRESKGSRKHGRFEGNEGAAGSRSLQTPINLFEDECVFCHSFRTSLFHGPMLQLQYVDGRLVPCDKKGNPTNSNTMYVHKKCMEWAPRVFYEGDTIKNLEKEISRASKLRCSRCRIPGAALGCYSARCKKNFHVPCAVMIPDCRWDVDNGCVLCPKHATEVLPCEETSSPKKESDNSSCIPQNHSNQYSVKEISIDCQTEDEQIDQLTTSKSSLPGQSLDEQAGFVIYKREDQQVDLPDTSTSFSLPQGQCSEKEVFANYQTEGKQIDQRTSRTSPTDQWVLLGSSLSAPEKDALKKFASLTNATVAEEWDKNVTHVIVGRGSGFACSRSFEVLIAILSGKWVVAAEWIVDCLGELIPGPVIYLEELVPGPETPYEVKFFHRSRTSIAGPKKGRTRASEGAPNLFSGLYFCLSTYMDPEERQHIQKLIAAAEGQILEGSSLHSLCENLDRSTVKLYFIYDARPPRAFTPNFSLDLSKELEEAAEYGSFGAQVISQLTVFNAIATYDAQTLDYRDDHLTCE